MIHTIRDTPPNPSGLLALSTDSSHCYLAYPGTHDNDADDDVDDRDHDAYNDVQATLTPESSKCLTASIWPAGWVFFFAMRRQL